MPSSDVPRAVRQAYRRVRGIRPDALVALAGILAGVAAGAVAWSIIKFEVLDYRAEVLLTVGPKDRADEAARELASRVNGEEFQARWRAAADQVGLADRRSLKPETLDAKEGQVKLVCLGRPRLAALQALARARDELINSQISGLRLKPPGLREKIGELQERIAGKAKALAADRSKEQELDRLSAGQARELRGLDAAVEAAEKQRDSARTAWLSAGSEPEAEARHRELLAEGAQLAAEIGKPRELTDEEQRRLRQDHARLGQTLQEDALQDSTPDHPIVRRMEQIRKTLRSAEVARSLEATAKRIAGIRARKAKCDAAEAELGKLRDKLDTRKKEPGGTEALRGRIAQQEAALKRDRDELARVESLPWTAVDASVAGPVVGSLPGGALVWPCLAGGVLAGVLLAFGLRRYAPAGLLAINDEAALAAKLHVPVLGVVPRLPGLARRQE